MLISDPLAFLDQEYPLSLRSSFIPLLQTGAELVNAIVNEHAEIYANGLSPNIKGRLFSYAVMLQFTPDAGLFSTADYATQLTTVNRFKYKIPEIISPNAVLHIAKVHSRNTLPVTSRYKERYAICNNEFCSQVVFDFPKASTEDLKYIEARKYVLLTYGSRDNRAIDFAQLVIPNDRFTSVVNNGIIDLSDEFQKMPIRPKVVYEEKTILKLRDTFRQHWGDLIKEGK